MQSHILNDEWLVETLFEAQGNLFDIGTAVYVWHKHGEFVPTDASQGVRVAELAFHA